MGLVLFALAIGLGAVVLQPAADPGDAARARERLAASIVLPSPRAAPTIAVRAAPLAMPAPLVITPRQPLPAALAPPPEVASAVPADAGEAARATALTVRDASRQLVYRLQDGRTFVLLQSHPGSDRPFLSSYSLDEGSVRGYPAQLITTRSRVLRSLISWTEGPAAYLMYSGSLTVRDLVRLAEQLR